MKKRKQNSKKEKLLLDTSIQIGKFVPNPERDIRSMLPKDALLYSSYFVLYEFKSGFIKHLIEFYYRVKIMESPSAALAWWSNKFSNRELTNILILQAIMAKITKSIPTQDTEKYLRLLEGIIFDLITNFDTDLRGMVGEFGGDEIVKFQIDTSEDYESFLEKYKSRQIIQLDKFWAKNIEQLKSLINAKDSFGNSKKMKTLYENLLLIEKELEKANEFRINKSLGDIVIATDTPKNLTLTTIDRVFKIYCSILGKRHLNLLESGHE